MPADSGADLRWSVGGNGFVEPIEDDLVGAQQRPDVAVFAGALGGREHDRARLSGFNYHDPDLKVNAAKDGVAGQSTPLKG